MRQNRVSRILLGFFVLILLFVAFLISSYNKASSTKKNTSPQTKKVDYAIRGSIYSSDGFTIASSAKLYKASINTQSIDPEKMDIFVNLFSIYTSLPKEKIREKLKKRGYVVLSYDIDTATAANLRSLNYKLDKYKVFREYEDRNGKIVGKMGIDIEISGNKRSYLYEDSMEPLIGYVRKIDSDKITRTQGVKGIENSKENILKSRNDGVIYGNRDVGFNIIQNKYSKLQEKQNGLDIVLSIPLKLQKKIENAIDTANTRLKAKEIIVGVMDSFSGEIIALASTNRFDPQNIKQNQYSHLNINAIELSYEPGSTIKPIIYAILLEKNMIDFSKRIDLNNGQYKIGPYTIRDSHVLKSATPEEIIIKSSNIGMIKLTQNLDGLSYFEGLKSFGLSNLTGIDLPYEKTGVIPTINKLNSAYKASVSYGYGMRATFIQILRAYASFSNGGYLPTPYINSFYIDSNANKYRDKRKQNISVISPKTAEIVKNTLIKVLKDGTGKNAMVEGVISGGKTGTARIYSDGAYLKKHNGSFFGFVTDNKKSYTIGVVVFESDANGDYYGSKSAAPIFKDIVNILIEENYIQKKQN